IATALADGVAARGDRADWATTGGSTVVSIYNALLRPENVSRIPWRMVHTWWGDERYVPADHPWSSVRPFDDVLLDGGAWEGTHSDDPRGRIQVRVANVHPFRPGASIGDGGGPDGCARELAAELRAASLPEQDGWPVLDLVLLGVG